MRYSFLNMKTEMVLPATLGSLQTLQDVQQWLLATGVDPDCVRPVEVDADGDLLRLLSDQELRDVPAERRVDDGR